MKSWKVNRFQFFSFLILSAGAIWIWMSKVPPGKTLEDGIPAPQKGFQAPDFSLENANGEIVKLSDLRGNPVLVNVWTSWCLPCQKEMPALEKVYRDYQSKGLAILAVNATEQDTRSQAAAFAQEQGLTFPVLFDESGEVSRLYKVRALPTSFFIDKDGTIQEIIIGGPMAEALVRIRVQQLFETTEEENP